MNNNFKIRFLLNLALGIAVLDGGFVIAIQVFTFLLTYFFATTQVVSSDMQSLSSISTTNLILAVIGMLNLSVVIFRITSLTRGNRPNLFKCYDNAIRRLPALALLYILCGVALILILPLIKLLNDMFAAYLTTALLGLVLLTFMLVPYGIMICIEIITNHQSPLRALIAVYSNIRSRISRQALATLSLCYAIPFCINIMFGTLQFAAYVALFSALWFLAAHILTMVVYANATVQDEPQQGDSDDNKKTEIIV